MQQFVLCWVWLVYCVDGKFIVIILCIIIFWFVWMWNDYGRIVLVRIGLRQLDKEIYIVVVVIMDNFMVFLYLCSLVCDL